MKYIMSLDQGTTSSRCILFDKSGNICASAQKEFRQIYPHPGWVEHNAMEIWDTTLEVSRSAMDKLQITADDDNFRRVTALPQDGTPVKMYVDYIKVYSLVER